MKAQINFLYFYICQLLTKLYCLIFFHSWTSKPELGILPTPEQSANGKDGFIEYSRIYCKRCNTIHPNDRK